MNNMGREIMAALKRFQVGSDGDPVTIGGQLAVTGTTTTSPAIVAAGDTNTGIFFPAADTIAFAEGGAEAMRINSSGNVGVGTTSPSGNNIFGNAKLAVVGAGNTTNPGATLTGYTGTGSTGASPTLSLQRSIGTTDGSMTQLTSSPWRLGQILFRGSDGTNFQTGAAIDALSASSTYSNSNSPGILRFLTTASSSISPTERMRITSAGEVLVGGTTSVATAGGTGELTIQRARTATFQPALNIFADDVTISSTDVLGWVNWHGNDTTSNTPTKLAYVAAVASGTHAAGDNPTALVFGTTAAGSETVTERMRITSTGEVLVGKTNSNTAVAGAELNEDGLGVFVRDGGIGILVNRLTSDGDLVSFRQAGTQEGTISVSGNTVSYNAFCGGHWTQLKEGRGYNPDIPRGTVMSSIGEMAVWKSVEWTETIEHPAVEAVEAIEAVLDEDGNVIEPAVEAVEGKDAWTESIPHRESYLGNLDIGATFEEDGFTKTVVDDGNERLPKVKISDVVGDKAVYGVFQAWDEVEDMLISSLGAFVVRVAAGVTVEIGDLLESNGDGCAKVQDDDIIRSKTIGKVTSTVATDTYDDGSYTVPCVLYCG
jgi:hypothetical protein